MVQAKSSSLKTTSPPYADYPLSPVPDPVVNPVSKLDLLLLVSNRFLWKYLWIFIVTDKSRRLGGQASKPSTYKSPCRSAETTNPSTGSKTIGSTWSIQWSRWPPIMAKTELKTTLGRYPEQKQLEPCSNIRATSGIPSLNASRNAGERYTQHSFSSSV